VRRVPAAGAAVVALALAGCAAPYDGDGELALAGGPSVPKSQDATHVVVDTDLGGDDLAALAFLVRHPDVVIEAVTIAGAGLVGCDPGVDLVADLYTALGEPTPPVACPSSGAATATGAEFPEEWRRVAETGTGIPRPASTTLLDPTPAPRLIGRLAGREQGLVVVGLGPLTNLAELARSAPEDYERLTRVHVMGGSVDGEMEGGVAEWNAAADPAAFEAVLDAGVPVTVVPADAVPAGTPELLSSAPGVARVAATIDYPAWWDLATAAALVTGAAEVSTGRWALDDSVPGRLERLGDGDVEVVRSLDGDELEAAYAEALG